MTIISSHSALPPTERYVSKLNPHRYIRLSSADMYLNIDGIEWCEIGLYEPDRIAQLISFANEHPSEFAALFYSFDPYSFHNKCTKIEFTRPNVAYCYINPDMVSVELKNVDPYIKMMDAAPWLTNYAIALPSLGKCMKIKGYCSLGDQLEAIHDKYLDIAPAMYIPGVDMHFNNDLDFFVPADMVRITLHSMVDPEDHVVING